MLLGSFDGGRVGPPSARWRLREDSPAAIGPTAPQRRERDRAARGRWHGRV